MTSLPCRYLKAAPLIGLILPWAAQAEWLDDSHLNLGMRNFFVDRDWQGNHPRVSRDGSWSQGFDLRFTSGYTEGPLQFGLDADLQYAVRLDGGGGRGPDSVLPFDRSSGEPVHDYGRAGLTAKLKYAKTELKIGELRPLLPVVSLDDSRQLVTTFQGALVTSNEVDKLTLTAGRLSEISTRESSNREKLYLFTGPNGPRRPSDGMNLGGATYAFTPDISASYFQAQLEDIYQQRYLGLALNTALGNGYSLRTDVRYFDNSEDGRALYGDIDNRAYGALATLRKGPHAVAVGYQRMLGDSAFPTLNGFTPQPFLLSWSAVAFIKPDERTWQARYDYDFAAMGLPGLRLLTRYQRGTGIDRSGELSDSHESERDLFLSYVVQNGPLKGLGVEWRNIEAKFQHANDYTENRLITAYTWTIW